MKIILTSFAYGEQQIQKTSNETNKALNSSSKTLSVSGDENGRIANEIQNNVNKSVNPPPSQGVRPNVDPKTKNNPNPSVRMNQGYIAPHSEEEPPKYVSRTKMAQREFDPSVVKRIDTGSSVDGAKDSIFSGDLFSSEKQKAVKTAPYPTLPKYRSTSDISSKNANTSSALAGLSGVYRR